MEGLQEVTNALSNGTIHDPLRPRGVSKTFRALIYEAHRTVIFVIAQLSCFFLLLMCIMCS